MMRLAMKTFEKEALLFLLKHLLSGVAGAVVLGTGILLFDVAHIATLIRGSDYGIVAAILLYSGLIVTFGSVAMGIGIMTMNDDPRP